MFEDDFDELDNFENYLEKDKSRAKRRHKDISKALRKASISKLVYQFNFPQSFGQFYRKMIPKGTQRIRFIVLVLYVLVKQTQRFINLEDL